jgi:hypothetical protein
MSNYDKSLKQKPKGSRPTKKAGSDRTWNLLTIVMVVLTLCSCGYFTIILRNPNSGLNVAPPKTLVPPPPTATITPLGFEPTWTPTPSLVPTETPTRRPTITPIPSNTAYTVSTATLTFTPADTVVASRTPRPTGVPYNVTVSWEDSTKFRPDTSCSSMYVAGKVLDSGNSPKTGLQVKLGGSIPGKVFLPEQNTTLTGISPIYGPSGFEFDLKIAPVASTKGLWVQLFDQSGAPLSDQVSLKTYSDCNKNLILVNFKQK